jgi:hypothetical protein
LILVSRSGLSTIKSKGCFGIGFGIEQWLEAGKMSRKPLEQPRKMATCVTK